MENYHRKLTEGIRSSDVAKFEHFVNDSRRREPFGYQIVVDALLENIDANKALISECNDWVNDTDVNDETPLYVASARGYVDVCRLLITEGQADVNKASKHGETSLYMASTRGHVGVCSLLIKEGIADVNMASQFGETPLYAASQGGHVDVCKLLVTEGNADVNKARKYGETPLYVTSQEGHVDVCRFLITEGKADVNKARKDEETPLYTASDKGFVDVCRLLITEGKADVNKARQYGETPLYVASARGHVDVCRLLITEGKADVNKALEHGETPLYVASVRGHEVVCRLLITEGKADVNKASKNAETPLYTASDKGFVDLCRLLITEGKADVDKPRQDGRTPLHAAVGRQHIALCKMLIGEFKADSIRLDHHGNIPLDLWPTNEQRALRQELVAFIKLSQTSALLKTGSSPVKTVKLFLVGHPAKGKSTLKKSLTTGVFKSLFTNLRNENRTPTPGILVEKKRIGGAGSFMVWDTAGQVEFHITHSMLLGTGQGIFIVVYSCCDPEDEQIKQLKYWICFIKACHDPTEKTKPVIQIVGTHVDQSKDVELASTLCKSHLEYLQRIFHEHVHINDQVILLDGRKSRSNTLESLKDALNILAEPLRGELTPKICDEIMKRISSWCKEELPLMYFKDFAEKVRQHIDRLVKDETLYLALGYLHNMGQVHHARLRDRDAIIIVHPNWLTTTILAPIFAPPDFRADYSGLPLKQEYTKDDLLHYFKLQDQQLLLQLLEYFELVYRNDDDTFIIPAKLPESTHEISWADNPKFQRYFGRRIECRDLSDVYSMDTFPCLQVTAMNHYRRKDVKPKLSQSAVKVFGAVEGMIQLMSDKRAIHIAVRVEEGLQVLRKGRDQLQVMESIVFDQITERSRGTDVTVSYLSPVDLKTSCNLEDDVRFYSEEALKDAMRTQDVLVHPVTLVPESVHDVNPVMNDQSAENIQASQPSSSRDYDVMISYQWHSQSRMLKLKDKLTAVGMSVWMDVEQMAGNLNDRMAEAVEGSAVILICFSKKYEESLNCKKEANYADFKKKRLIPLKYDEHEPSGWLGLLIGSLLYYDVSTDEALDDNFDDIVRDIRKTTRTNAIPTD